MTPEQEALKELMEVYDAHHAQWLRLNKNDNGFDKWFTSWLFEQFRAQGALQCELR